MCTLTIVRGAGRTTLTMNRDDAAARPEASPEIASTSGLRFVAPKDLEAGGTWIAANERQVAACLLNRYDVAPKGQRTRGEIVVEAMAGANVEEARRRLEALSLHRYSPFACLILGPRCAVRFDWNGSQLAQREIAIDSDVMLTSSSWRFDEVQERRERLFQEVWTETRCMRDRLDAFHCRSAPDRERWTPMMRREASETKSITQIELSANGVEMRYWRRETAAARQLFDPDSVHTMP